MIEERGALGAINAFTDIVDTLSSLNGDIDYRIGVFHADRLYDFTKLLGANGYAADLCAGTQAVPKAVKTALTDSIDLACMKFDPPR